MVLIDNRMAWANNRMVLSDNRMAPPNNRMVQPHYRMALHDTDFIQQILFFPMACTLGLRLLRLCTCSENRDMGNPMNTLRH